MYTDLVALAKEPSSENRRAVMQKISDLFVDGIEDHNDRELVLFGDVFCQLLDKVELEDRVALAERVAPLPQTAPELANRLARDESAAVASPVLMHSPVLSDADLRDIAQTEGQGHLLAISKRSSLPETVTDVLIDRGDQRVLEGVSSNTGARFSDNGLQQLTFKAMEFPEIVGHLTNRDDIPFERLDRIVASFDKASSERLRDFVDRHREAAAELLRETQEKMAATRLEREREEQQVRFMAAMIRDGKRHLDATLEELIGAKRLVDIATLLAELGALNEAHVSNVLHKVNDFGIALVCRSVDVGERTYHALSLLRCERLRLPALEAERMTAEYMMIDRASTERALRFHKVRASVMGV
jgi:uncharacterized protein (DUF2336 family)